MTDISILSLTPPRQCLFWPVQYLEWTLNLKKTPLAQAQYIGVFNTFWCVANDIIIGTALKQILLDTLDPLIILLSHLQLEVLEWIESGVHWLMLWPGGIKVNRELASFLGELFLWMVVAWRGLFYIFYPVDSLFYVHLILHTHTHIYIY
jgi:phosphatidylinositol glycan class Q protein